MVGLSGWLAGTGGKRSRSYHELRGRRQVSRGLLLASAAVAFLLAASCSLGGSNTGNMEPAEAGGRAEAPAEADGGPLATASTSAPGNGTAHEVPGATSEDGKALPNSVDGPRIALDEDSVHLGEATPEQKIDWELPFRNVGGAPLVVQKVGRKTLEGC